MNITLHTPGPWQVSPYNNITSRNGTVAKTEQMPGNYDSEREANARLIAAAPDLLTALSGFVQLYQEGQLTLEGDDGKDPLVSKAIAAIAKAKGEK